MLAYSLHDSYTLCMAWIYKRNGSENWWIGYRVNGKQHLRSTATSDETKAKRELAKLNTMDQAHKAGRLDEEFFRLLTKQQGGNDTLKAVVNQWIGECKELAIVTVRKYQDGLDDFCDYVGADDASPLLRDIQRDTIAKFLREKRTSTSAATTKHTRRILAIFFNYAVDNQVIPFSPVPSTKSMKLRGDSKVIRRAFTVEELGTLFSKAPTPFWQYMVVMGFYIGQRMGDLISMPWGAVDFLQNQIRFIASKTGKRLVIPMHPSVRTLLDGLKATAGAVKPTTPIWPEESKQYEQFGAGGFSNDFYNLVLLPAGLVPKRTHHAKKGDRTRSRQVNDVSFHCLRHTFVSLLKITGATQATAKELAGHSSDEISDLYTHVPEAELAKAIGLLPEVTK